MGKIYDVCYVTGRYTTKEGEEKAKWKTIGCIIQNEKGSTTLILDRDFNPAALPAGEKNNSCMLNLFKPKDKNISNTKNSSGDMDDSYPF